MFVVVIKPSFLSVVLYRYFPTHTEAMRGLRLAAREVAPTGGWAKLGSSAGVQS